MSKLDLFTKLANPEQLIADLLGETNDLGHASTLKTAKKADLDKTLDLPVPGAKATFAGQLEVALLNDEKDGDQDPAGVFGAKRKPLPELPWLVPGAGQVWLRYAAELRAGLSGEAAADPLSASLQLETDATLAAYRVHTPDESLVPALRSDLGDFRTLLSLEHLQAAAVGEVHSLILGAKLGLGLKVSIAEILPAALRELKVGLPGAADLTLACSMGIKATAAFSIAGDFELLIGKTGPDRHVVSLRKASTRTLGADLTIGGEIGIKLPPLEQIPGFAALRADILARVLNGVTEDDLAKLEPHAGQTIAQLPAALQAPAQKAADALAKALGKAANKKIDDILGDYKATLEQIATAFTKGFETTLKFGLGLTWRRVSTHEVLARTTLSSAELAGLHHDLLRLRTDPLRALIAAGGDRDSSFLSTHTLARTTGITFGASLPGFALKTDASRKRTFTRVTDGRGRLRPTFAEDISRIDTLWAETNRSQISFVATRDVFESPAAILLNEFRHQLTLRFDYDDKRVSEADVRDYVDTAALWSGTGLSAGDIQARIDRILDWHESEDGPLNLRCELSAHPDALAAIWRQPASDDLVAECFAAAMGPGKRHPVLHDIPARQRLFQPVWLQALQHTGPANAEQFAAAVAGYARRHLQPIDASLADVQVQPFPRRTHGPRRTGNRHAVQVIPHVAASIAYPLDDWRKSIRQLRDLGSRLVSSPATDWEGELERAAAHLVVLRADPIYLRFYGRLLRRLADAAQVPVGPAFTVSLVARKGEGDDARVLLLS